MPGIGDALMASEEPLARLSGLATAVRLLGAVADHVELEHACVGELGRALEDAAGEMRVVIDDIRRSARGET